jgi:hypothetical protein
MQNPGRHSRQEHQSRGGDPRPHATPEETHHCAED